MEDVMPKKAPPAAKAKTVAKAKGKTTINMAASQKSKAPMLEKIDDEEAPVHLKKLRPFMPAHDDSSRGREHEREEG